MLKILIQSLGLALALATCLAANLSAQGVTLKAEASVLYGSADKCTQPATVDFAKVKKLTPEWKLIKTEGVDKGSARYALLVEDMNRRIRRLCEEVAKSLGKDCVLRKGDIESEKGLAVSDVTDEVVAKLESGSIGS